MSDFSNPFAGDADFQYLALDRKKLLEEAPPYDPKTSCWVPDHKLGYIRSNIQSTKGDDVVVLTEAGEVRHAAFCRVSRLSINSSSWFHFSPTHFGKCAFPVWGPSIWNRIGRLHWAMLRLFAKQSKLVCFRNSRQCNALSVFMMQTGHYNNLLR